MAVSRTGAARSRAGRRPGSPDTRALILSAAKTEFATKGFDRASVRGIARAAGVDAALVHHYFGSKDDLMLAALEMPFDPREMVPAMTATGTDGLGLRIATTFLSIWDDDDKREPLVALIKASITSEAAANLLQNGVARMVIAPISAAIDADGRGDAQLRADLVVSQLLGLAVARYVVRLEPLASASAEQVAALLAPALQRYLGEGALRA